MYCTTRQAFARCPFEASHHHRPSVRLIDQPTELANFSSSISPPVRAHPITKTCEVTTRSPIAMATASTVDLQLDRHGLTVIN
ncbi:BZ3501_MvSof-1269-A2-R1_C69g00388 [Microbotryum saponariae]|nr:BZ3501_MvSof-1269-A2-R1_C69g00388 [Microbotryum saponariae]